MKRTFVTKDQLVDIAGRYPTPFHLYDEAGIRANMEAVREAFSWNPGFREYFAVKANPNPALISILREYGCGCDCSSSTELMIARALNVPGPEIMFSSNDTPAADFRLARELGAIVNFDDISHIPFFERVAGPIPETVSCRFNPGGLFRLANDIMDNPGDSKYGMTEEQLFEAFRMLRERGAKTFGIHAFLASNTVTNDYYPALARILFELAVRLQRAGEEAIRDRHAGVLVVVGERAGPEIDERAVHHSPEEALAAPECVVVNQVAPEGAHGLPASAGLLDRSAEALQRFLPHPAAALGIVDHPLRARGIPEQAAASVFPFPAPGQPGVFEGDAIVVPGSAQQRKPPRVLFDQAVSECLLHRRAVVVQPLCVVIVVEIAGLVVQREEEPSHEHTRK